MMERAVNHARCTRNGEYVWYFHGQRCTCSAVGSLMGLGGIHYQWVCREQASVVANQITPPLPFIPFKSRALLEWRGDSTLPHPKRQRESWLLVTFCHLYICAIITALATPKQFLKTLTWLHKVIITHQNPVYVSLWFSRDKTCLLFFSCNYQISVVHPQVFT